MAKRKQISIRTQLARYLAAGFPARNKGQYRVSEENVIGTGVKMGKPRCMYHDVSACPDCGEPLCVPNWSDRKDVESLIGRKISRETFDKIREHVELILADEISGSVRDVVVEYLKREE